MVLTYNGNDNANDMTVSYFLEQTYLRVFNFLVHININCIYNNIIIINNNNNNNSNSNSNSSTTGNSKTTEINIRVH